MATQVFEAAVDAGVDVLVLCDTNGGTLPWEVRTRYTKNTHISRGHSVFSSFLGGVLALSPRSTPPDLLRLTLSLSLSLEEHMQDP